MRIRRLTETEWGKRRRADRAGIGKNSEYCAVGPGAAGNRSRRRG